MSQAPAGEPTRGAGNRIVLRGVATTWGELDTLDLPPAAAVLVEDNLQAARAVWTHATSDRETLVTSRTRVTPDLGADLRAEGLALVSGDLSQVEPATLERDAQPGRIWLLTSGSTGRPKRVAHTLDSLTTVGGDQPARTWLCPYAHGAYAWWQVVTLGLTVPGQDVVFIEPDELDTWPRMALDAGVTAASGTPTFWRQALYRDPEAVAALPLEQVTLGGEPVDQAILDRLIELFPKARVSWIYASSEAGASIAVHDGKAGFPEAWLDRDTPGRPRLSIVDGELVIASPKRGEGIDEHLRTGDRVEVVDGRVLITGRLASDEINVGGSKASASQVRDVLQSHPAVAWASVKGRKAPIVGNIVTAEIVTTEPVSDDELSAWARERLPEYAVPRRLRFLDAIPIKETLKSDV
ncbi:AMP-binding protein [Knoellia subterranea]|uniref:Acyl-CoA synthetase n=1 Tax=Knoellia subterranea KCTC 19937 TaxID=1385521 RepID=A0A0A0JMS5_9MICO|nr:AMP-binding protein [Knoellia subterranea]KGN36926.1 acyl-CoA synthetase [Knoellia subterranea KCTC 19937]